MTVGELISLLEKEAKKYRKHARISIARNFHMNELTQNDIAELTGKKNFADRVIDAALVDFINYVAVGQGCDLGLYVKHLKQENAATS